MRSPTFVVGLLVAWSGAPLWYIDRIEPPLAVLVDAEGRVLDVPVATLPAGAEVGDALATPRGPVVGDRRRRREALQRRFDRLLLATPAPASGQGNLD